MDVFSPARDEWTTIDRLATRPPLGHALGSAARLKLVPAPPRWSGAIVQRLVDRTHRESRLAAALEGRIRRVAPDATIFYVLVQTRMCSPVAVRVPGTSAVAPSPLSTMFV
jgi:hypothetical protein